MLRALTAGRRARAESGFTLVELIVSMGLLLIVSAVMTTALIASHFTLRDETDEASGLSDVRTASERLARDIRDARGVTVGDSNAAYNATASQLTVWIDYNSDYVQQDSETITWKLLSAGGGHYNLVRSIKSGASQIEARTIISSLAFSYIKASGAVISSPASPASSDTDIDGVIASMQYDATIGQGSQTRTITFQARLRNAS